MGDRELNYKLRPVRPGDPATAEDQNELRDAFNRVLEGVNPPRQVRRRGRSIPLEGGQFQLVEDLGDYFSAYEYDEVTDTLGDSLYYIAKMWLLRVTPFDAVAAGRNGFTYVYSDYQTRVSTKTSDSTTETQVVTPPYVAGDVVFATRNWTRGTGVTRTDSFGDTVDVEWVEGAEGGMRIWAKESA